jgi:hypothetical protein
MRAGFEFFGFIEKATTMSPVSRELLESVSSWAEVLTFVLTFLAAMSGIVYVLTIKPLRKIEVREVQEERQKTAKAQTEAAQAQLALKQYVDVVAKSVNSRRLDSKRFIELMSGKPKGTAEVWYVPNDEEAYEFAFNIHRWLGPEGAGWNILSLKPVSNEEDPDGRVRKFASSGMVMISNKPLTGFDNAPGALRNAISLSVGGWGIVGDEWSLENPALSENYVIVVVGHHQVNVPLVTFTPPAKK